MGFRVPSLEASELSSGAFIDFDKYKERWYEWCKAESPSSARRYKGKLEKYLSGRKINTPEELREVINSIPPAKSGNPDKHAFNAIANFLRFLEKEGIRRPSELKDFRVVIPFIKSEARPESEKVVEEEQILKAYDSIIGKENTKKARQLFFKLSVFTGLRENEVAELMNQFDPEILERSYTAFNIPLEWQEKIAIYDMETVRIPGRKNETKRAWIAIFPKELVKELIEFKKYGIEMNRSLYRKDRMYKDEGKGIIDTALLRKFHMNFLNDNALKVPEMPADVYRIIEFMQGRAPKEVGGRNYRANAKTAAKLYYYLVDEFKKAVPIF